jgi:hypothetical protein
MNEGSFKIVGRVVFDAPERNKAAILEKRHSHHLNNNLMNNHAAFNLAETENINS